jgi:hypothetical protein
VDKSRRELRFEGDKERWRIPAASITGCQIEYFVHGQGAGAQSSITSSCAPRAKKDSGKRRFANVGAVDF